MRHQDQRDQRQPEEPVRYECRHPERIVLLRFQDARDDLGRPAIAEPHGQDHCVHAKEAGIVQIEQDGGHSECEKPQRSRICRVVLDLKRR